MQANGNIGVVKHNGTKYELHFGGKVLARSGDRGYFEYHIAKRDVPKLVEANITSVVFEDGSTPTNLALVPTAAAAQQVAARVEVPTFEINERFDMLDELITMVVNGTNHKAMVIGGKGGIGKSFAVQTVLNRMGKVDATKAISDAREKAKADLINPDSTDEEVQEKVNHLAGIEALGDYRIIKGYASPSALYRILYENKNKVIVFDDCDSVLRDADAVNVLKSALDSNEERWVSWNTNAAFSDLPPCFLFQGQVIFVTNMDMDKLPEPIMTRCLKVNMAMSPMQRIERMRGVLSNVMPDVDMQYKEDALNLLEKHVHVTKNVNFRALMQTIGIRIDPATKNWERLALFSLIEN